MAVQSVSIPALTAFAATAVLEASASAGIRCSPLTAFNAAADLSAVGVQSVQLSPLTAFRASPTLTGGTDTDGMNLCDVLDVVLGVWSITGRCFAPDYTKKEALNIINASLQLVWNNADERTFWTNETLTITLAASVASQALPDTIQNVTGPCRLEETKRPLAPIGTMGEYETFADIYLDGDTVDQPVAYHIDRQAQVGNEPAKITLFVVPAPTEETDFLLDVVREAPRYSVADLATCPTIPIPHRYVESLLLPVARYQASTFRLFRSPEIKETIDREYQQARISLGLADPLPGDSGDNRIKREPQ
jgi:hypothetical protein